MELDMRAYAARRVAENRPRLAWATMVGEEPGLRPEDWQEILRQNLRMQLKPLNLTVREPLEPVVHETVRLDGYRRETVTFTTRPNLTAFGYLLIPDDCPPNSPAALCLPGHGRGVDSIVGIAEDGSQRGLGEWGEYQADFALQCVARGFPTFALEQISFGHRRDERARKEGPGASSCVRDSMAALTLGECMIGWRVWDAMRAIDYLATRPEVDPKRIAVLGISGGGTTALFTAALDVRVAACVVSGYLNTFADSILAVPHCVDNFAPGILTLCEMPDVAGLIAPRLLFAESGTRDSIFPLHGFEKATRYVRQIFERLRVPENLDREVFENDHVFHGKGAFEFLNRRLRGAVTP
ncbi:MAG: alpha/beta hydrolase family protein [Capsulimonadales bacterium]|nr:alpha/beta hydrolase family protein [Capsulimonadales bacterium]